MKKRCLAIGIAVATLFSVAACSPRAVASLARDIVGSVVAEGTLDDAYALADDIAADYTAELFEDENAVEKETISAADIQNITLDSLYAALYIEVSSDADIHLQYPKKAHFEIRHEAQEGTLRVSADVDTPSNYDVLKLFLPPETIQRLDILEGASSVTYIGQEGLLETCNIEVALATVYLESIYADTTVKVGSGTIRMSNDTIRSNIRLQARTGVIDVSLGELPDDVSLYAEGRSVTNSFFRGSERVSPDEQYVVALENKVGGIRVDQKAAP